MPNSRPIGRTDLIRTSPSWMIYSTWSPASSARASLTALGNVVCPFAVILESIMTIWISKLYFRELAYDTDDSKVRIPIARSARLNPAWVQDLAMRLPDVGYRTDGGRYEEFALDAPYLSAMAIGTPGGTRTPDPLLRRQPLCPLSYRRKSRSDCTRVAKAYHTTGGQWRPLQNHCL